MESGFIFTDRARPVVEIGTGDTRTPLGQATWDVARWDSGDKWASTEPVWHDITCESRSFRCEYGRQITTERFVPGVATVIVDNASGWADPSPLPPASDMTLSMRPGRSIRLGVLHAELGPCWLFRGFIDAVTPQYSPFDVDTVQLDCIDALGEVNRAKWTPLPAPVGDGESASDRALRILAMASWPPSKLDVSPASVEMIASDLGGQAADLLGTAALSCGGAAFGNLDGAVAFRPQDWQLFEAGSPLDGTISNDTAGNDVNEVGQQVTFFLEDVIFGYVNAGVCPTGWERPFQRSDISTRVIMGRDEKTAITVDDLEGQALYGIEPYVRTNLWTRDDSRIAQLADRILTTRAAATAPRVRSVSLDAATAPDALDMMATVDVYKPSRYRCQLVYPRGEVFDTEYLATAVVHDVDSRRWSLRLNLDLAAPYGIVADTRWDTARWDVDVWSSQEAVPA